MKLPSDDNNKSSELIDISHYIDLIKRKWLAIIIFAILVTGITVLIALSMPSKYTATATLLIEAQEKKAVSIDDVVGIDANQKDYFQTQFEILRSNQIAQAVIDKLGIDDFKEFNPSIDSEKSILQSLKENKFISSFFKSESDQKAGSDEATRQIVLKLFKNNLSIDPIIKTQLVNISFTSEDPQLAAKVANAIGVAYIESNLDARLSVTKYASSWITSRLGELRQQLSDSEKALSDFLVKEKLINPTDSGIEALANQQLTSLTTRLAQVRDGRIRIESAYDALTSGNVTDVASLSAIPAISQHPQVIDIRNAELEAQNDVNELSKRYGPKHDKMIAANAKLKSIEKQAEEITRKLVKGFGKELQATKQQERLLQAEIQKQKAKFQELTVKKSRYDALQREVDTNREILNLFLTRQKETTATSNYDAANARFTDQALVPQLPSSPKRKLIVIGAFIASIFLAVTFVFIVDLLKSTIESVSDFEDKFGLIPIGGIPVVKDKKYKKVPIDNKLFFSDKEIAFSESIRSIRTSLMVSQLNEGGTKRIAVTSSLPEEGKTTVAVNVAMSFAKVENVLLVDLDLRKPAVAERFGLKKYHQGLTNHLLMNKPIDECIYVDETSGLNVLPAGMLTSSPQELLSSKKIVELFELLDNKFEKIIIDTPPTLPVSDSLIIGKLVDSMVVVVKANSTKQPIINNTISKLTNHEIKLEGIVVNKISFKAARENYSYGNYYGAYQES
ncbi:GumC family protein [Vibrio salinus]|uniref:GumC family protein n=1 Tax=Vibrio salinus TaxID=2899784 RepID=UPI001E5442B7|nr:polysaccharide biosynthesis tyrosine autokinase [Vibrio salinus]MCE0493310.1 polysaccharide biosynthesis tyrosine autokinase [Vibrio salinus]